MANILGGVEYTKRQTS